MKPLDEKRARARAAVIAKLAARLLPRASRKAPPASPYVVADLRPVQAPPPPPPTGQWRGSCAAVNPDTGRRCALLEGHEGAHRHGSTAFVVAAAPGQTHFRRLAALETAAASRRGFDAREGF